MVHKWISELLMFSLAPITLLGNCWCEFYTIFGVGHKSPNSDERKGTNIIILTMMLLSLLSVNQPNKINTQTLYHILNPLVNPNRLIYLLMCG